NNSGHHPGYVGGTAPGVGPTSDILEGEEELILSSLGIRPELDHPTLRGERSTPGMRQTCYVDSRNGCTYQILYIPLRPTNFSVSWTMPCPREPSVQEPQGERPQEGDAQAPTSQEVQGTSNPLVFVPGDFILLAFVCRQSVVFRIERRYSSSQDYPGGSNRDITKECEEPGFINPVPDFITFTRSWLDVVKRVVFQVSLWVTLGLVFLAGTNRVNVFSLGYLVGTFVFLWQGEEMYLIPVQVIVRRWNVLLGYNVGVIMLKTALQIVGCVFIKEAQTHACWAVQLLGIGCIKKFGDITAKSGIADIIMSVLHNLEVEECEMLPRHVSAPTECNIPRDHVGLAWDGVCFAALILMRRLFRSYYFIRLVDETKAMTVLASSRPGVLSARCLVGPVSCRPGVLFQCHRGPSVLLTRCLVDPVSSRPGV
ncbi:unnamed protein product, partial [Timema podura]|nr:unnamed protein product [Timema podura]